MGLSPTAHAASAAFPLVWLPPAPVTQAHVFEYLSARINGSDPKNNPKNNPKAAKAFADAQQAALAAYPKTGTLTWALGRYRAATNGPAAYTLVYQDLLLAQQLLKTSDLTKQREGMRLAKNAQLCVTRTLDDKKLYVRVFEGFLLPYLGAAYSEEWQDLSRQQITGDAYSAYAATGDVDHAVGLLRLFLSLDSSKSGSQSSGGNQNGADWARGQLAQALAGQGRYGEAIGQLHAIQTADFTIKQMIPVYQQAWDKQKSADKQKLADKTKHLHTPSAGTPGKKR